jgi:hypothetical protein
VSNADPDFCLFPVVREAEWADSSIGFFVEPVTTTMFRGDAGGVTTDAAAEAYVNLVAVGDTGTTGIGASVLIWPSFFGGCARMGAPTRAEGKGETEAEEAASPKPGSDSVLELATAVSIMSFVRGEAFTEAELDDEGLT